MTLQPVRTGSVVTSCLYIKPKQLQTDGCGGTGSHGEAHVSVPDTVTHSELEQLFINSSVSSGTQTSKGLIRNYRATGYWLG